MLAIKNLKKSYGEKEILTGLDFELAPGEIVAIMGPSGCGKSTFIRLINRLVEPNAGEIIFQGQPVHALNNEELRKVRRKMGFVFQHFNLIRRLTAGENLTLGLIKAGFSKEKAYQQAEKVLADVGMVGRYAEPVTGMSGGEKQRIGIARALMMEPDLLLLDEPTAALDPILVRDVLTVLEKVVADHGSRSLIIVTHEIAFARKVADRIYFMDQGRFIESGPPERLFTQPESWIGQKYRDIIEYS